MSEKTGKQGKLKLILIASVVYLAIWGALKAVEWTFTEEQGQLVSITANYLVQIVNLLILIYVLNRLLYQPVLNLIEERNQRIQKQIDDAEADRAQARKLAEETQAELNRIRKESTNMLREARQEAQEEKSRLMEEANRDRSEMMERTQREIDNEFKAARTALQAQVANLAIRIAEKVIRKAQSGEQLRRMAEESLSEIESRESA